MVSVFMCEDNQKLLYSYENIVKNHIMINELDMEIKIATVFPDDIINYLKTNHVTCGLYFLDIQLDNSDQNGIELAVQIRKLDPFAKIVFISTHSEMAFLTFERKVEPLDFILKDLGLNQVKAKIEADIRLSYQRYLEMLDEHDEKFEYRIGSIRRSISMKELFYIESSTNAHKVILHAKNRLEEYYGSIADIVQQYPKLFQCHRSCLVNIDNVSSYDTKTKKINLIDGETCPLATRKIQQFEQVVNASE